MARTEGKAEELTDGLVQGNTEGLAQGRAEEKQQLAASLKSDGFSYDTITKYTGLSKEEIEKF